MPPKNSGGSPKFPGEHKVIHRTAQKAFVRVVTPRKFRSRRSHQWDYVAVTVSSETQHAFFKRYPVLTLLFPIYCASG